MKMKIYFVFFIVFISFDGYAQIKYFQDFEDGFGDMMLLDQDGKIPAIPVSDYGQTWTVKEDENGNHWAVSNSYFTEPAKANDWMITPLIENISENTIIQWQAFSYNSLFPEQYEVRVSPGGGSNPSDFTKIIYTVGEESNELVSRGISLAEFAGKDIRIAFRNISFDKYLLYVDEIKIEDVLRFNAAINDLKFEKYPLINSPSPISFDLLNTGAQTLHSVDFKLVVGNKEIFFTKPDLNLNYLDKFNFTPDVTMEHAKAEKLWIELTILSINGEAVSNNLHQFAVHFLQNPWKRKMIAEDMTSTHCSYCPKGIFYKNEINASSAEDIITISVHNGDIMTNAEYENGINDISEFNNFPKVVINRINTIDPGNLLTAVNNFRDNNFAPVKMNTSASKSGRNIFIETQVIFNTSFIDDDLRVMVSLAEDSVKGNSFSYDQSNIYSGGGLGNLGGFEDLPDPIPYEDIAYNHVARALPFGFEGKNDFLNLNYEYGDEALFAFEVFIDSHYVLENTKVIIMIADANGEIINAEQINLNLVSTSIIDNNKNIITSPNPTNGWCEIKADINIQYNNTSLSIFDSKGQLLREFKMYDHMVDLSDFPAGLYYFKIQNLSHTYFCKVLKI